MFYLVQTPRWLQKLYPRRLWRLPAVKKTLYLSFDDGPHPTITPFVLDTLQQYGAKATFFCIGRNVQAHPEIYQRILREGHAVGNHSFDHLNGWKTTDEDYLDNILKAGKLIDSNLYRPPYGRMTRSQEKKLVELPGFFITVMWTVLSGDFDKDLSPLQCWNNLHKHAKPGSIIVFHDSEKANEKMRYALPLVLEHFSREGYTFDIIQRG